jgi:hypothetical protein
MMTAGCMRALKVACSALFLALAGCHDMGVEVPVADPAPVPPGASVSFRDQVLPVFVRYGCFQCHGGTNGLITSTPADLLRGGLHGPAIVAGDAGASLIMKKISAAPPFGDRMPQGGPYLPDSTANLIRDWINQGANDN